MRGRLLIVVFLTLLLGAQMASGQEDLPELNITEYTLDNGLEVILVEDHSAPTVAVDIWYRVGGANDPEGRSGFAHLFEHMMFEGSAHVENGEFDDLLTRVGAENNAYTDTEVTGYYEIVPSHELPLALWLEADRMASLAVNTVNMNNQRAVVIEEFQFRVSNSPYGAAYQELFTEPYNYEPYQRWGIGNVEELNAANLDDVAAFHSTYYVPNNATLVVAGDIDVEETRELIDRLFGPIPAGDPVPELPAYEPVEQDEAQDVTIEDPLINLPILLMAYEIPTRTAEDFPALDLLNRILGTGDSSRLAQAALDTGIASYVWNYIDDNSKAGLFIIELDPTEGVGLEELQEVYDAELARIVEEGVTEEELEKAVNRVRSERIFSLESVLNLAESVQTANFFYDDPQAVFGELERYEAVTSEDIQRVAAEYLEPTDATILSVVPGGVPELQDLVEPTVNEGDESVEPAILLDEPEPPEPLATSAFALPEITETTLDNGLDVIVVNKPELPLISIDLYLPGGASADPEGQSGLAELTANLLTRGTETRTAQEIASTIEGVGGVIGASAGSDALSVGVAALSEDTELAFELLGDVALNSTFPEEELEVQRDIMLSDLDYFLADPNFVASRAFNTLVYGEHPYGRLTTFASIGGLTRDDVVAFYEGQLNPDDAFLIVAGDITTDEAVALAEATFGDWEAEGDPEPMAFPELQEPTGTQIYLIDRPGSTQAEFAIGNLGPIGNTTERYIIQVMNQVLGGGFNSRLSQNLREDKGYTYGIYSGYDFPVDRGTFSIGSAIGNTYVGDALREILAEIERIQQEEVPADELADVKSGLIGNYALGLETYQAFVDRLASLKLRGLPLESLEQYVPSVEEVGELAVQEAAQEFIDDDNLLIVVVGDASVIQEELEEIAPVTLFEPEA